MMMCISYASGILFVENLVLLAGLTATTMTFGYITELLNRPNGQIWIERNFIVENVNGVVVASGLLAQMCSLISN